MVCWANEVPKEAWADPFRPPDEPCLVRCMHCGQEYSSAEMIWVDYDGTGFWCCPMHGCDAMGFKFSIYPLDSPVWDDAPPWAARGHHPPPSPAGMERDDEDIDPPAWHCGPAEDDQADCGDEWLGADGD